MSAARIIGRCKACHDVASWISLATKGYSCFRGCNIEMISHVLVEHSMVPSSAILRWKTAINEYINYSIGHFKVQNDIFASLSFPNHITFWEPIFIKSVYNIHVTEGEKSLKKYRIIAVLMVETAITTCIAASLIRQTVKIVIT